MLAGFVLGFILPSIFFIIFILFLAGVKNVSESSKFSDDEENKK